MSDVPKGQAPDFHRRRGDGFVEQTDSYRTRADGTYRGFSDCLGSSFGQPREQAKACVGALRRAGYRAFAEHHPDGYSRVFVHRDDHEAAGRSQEAAVSLDAIFAP